MKLFIAWHIALLCLFLFILNRPEKVCEVQSCPTLSCPKVSLPIDTSDKDKRLLFAIDCISWYADFNHWFYGAPGEPWNDELWKEDALMDPDTGETYQSPEHWITDSGRIARECLDSLR